MSSRSPDCLTDSALDRFHAGALNSEEALRVKRHLGVCIDCARRDAALSARAEGLLDHIRGLALRSTDISGDSGDTTLDTVTEKAAKHFPRVPGYKIAGVLGQGGMGIVYRARQAQLNRTVALKVLPAIVGSANPSAVARFRREAKAAARLHHTNIVPIYDFGESSDAYCYAMELIPGQPLSTIIKLLRDKRAAIASPTRLGEMLGRAVSGNPLSTSTELDGDQVADDPSSSFASALSRVKRPYYQQVARWMADAADALHYAHGQGIIHRDVKPGNLILARDGRIMITDFGLAKSSEDESVTMTGTLLGTLRYVSPEQAMAKRVKVDRRTDVYSLGAVLYELLCFQPAFPGSDDRAVLGAIISRDPTRPRKIESTVPTELETICLKALEKSPDARFDTAQTLAEDLRRYQQDRPILAKRPGPVRRFAKLVRRRKALSIAIAASLLLVCSTGLWRREQVSRVLAERQRRSAMVSSLFDSGMFSATNGQWSHAEVELRGALELQPDNIRTLLGLVWLRIEHFKHEPALATRENLERALELCEKILGIESHELRALNYKGILLKKLGRYAEATAVTRRAVELQPKSFAAWSNLGAYHAMAGELDEAEAALRRGADLLGKNADGRPAECVAVWRNLAALELYRNMPTAAASLERAIECDSTDVPSWLLRSRLHLTLDGHMDVQEALDDAKYADRLSGESYPKVKRLRALAHLRMGEPDRAVEHAELAMEMNDSRCVNYLIIAAAKCDQQNPIAASEYLSAAQDKWPEFPAGQAFLSTYDEGTLWFESMSELEALSAATVRLIESRCDSAKP